MFFITFRTFLFPLKFSFSPKRTNVRCIIYLYTIIYPDLFSAIPRSRIRCNNKNVKIFLRKKKKYKKRV